ncbi:hypothetical protein L596_018454 [Steinernema carpocapsae]|uniref:Uncharacterized protein n=1 Tax=Steinernema carpocapsae TaxID=34508 RepID=A0A4U5N4N0_STECR|nr:hypothetical protein L596_018454 [Steinernema carpocapsae]
MLPVALPATPKTVPVARVAQTCYKPQSQIDRILPQTAQAKDGRIHLDRSPLLNKDWRNSFVFVGWDKNTKDEEYKRNVA